MAGLLLATCALCDVKFETQTRKPVMSALLRTRQVALQQIC